MGISLMITFGLMLFQHVTLTFNILFIIPVIIVLYIFSFGLGLLLMHFGVTLNDLGNLTNIALRMVFYLSGIFYNINERLTGNLKYFLLRLNPVAFLMNESRKVLLYGSLPSFEGLLVWLMVGILLCVVGVHVIHKNENSYAKVI
jgi:ABC-type polysaccharide/polyol phosphate export permease